MNILVLAPFLPHPQATSGAPRVVFDRLRLLAARHKVTVAALASPGDMKRQSDVARLGMRVYSVAQPGPAGNDRVALLRKRVRLAWGLLADGRPMLAQEFYSRAFCRLVHRITQHQTFDLVLVEHILAAQYIGCLSSTDLPVVLSEHDVRWAFDREEGYQIAGPRALGRLIEKLDRAKRRRYASRAYMGVAAVTVPTVEDARLLQERTPGVEPIAVPYGIFTETAAPKSGRQVREPASLLFVGNFDHPPNVDAARWLCAQIMPLVRSEEPAAILYLVGKNPPPEIVALAGERVIVTGEVPSVQPYLDRCSLFVAPIRKGGGVRVKLLEAMVAGIPVVTTSLGAQGLPVRSEARSEIEASSDSPGPLLIADSARRFADSVIRALNDEALREKLVSEAWRVIAEQQSGEDRGKRLEELLETVIARGRATPGSERAVLPVEERSP